MVLLIAGPNAGKTGKRLFSLCDTLMTLLEAGYETAAILLECALFGSENCGSFPPPFLLVSVQA